MNQPNKIMAMISMMKKNQIEAGAVQRLIDEGAETNQTTDSANSN